MPKFKIIEPGKDHWADYCFHCLGCGCDHGVWTTHRNDNNAIWQFNGDLNKPTVSPSLMVTWLWGPFKIKNVCHSFIRDGKIEYLSDCTHHLAGKTIELPEYNLI